MTMPRYLPVYFGKELGSCDVIQLSAPISGRISRARNQRLNLIQNLQRTGPDPSVSLAALRSCENRSSNRSCAFSISSKRRVPVTVHSVIIQSEQSFLSVMAQETINRFRRLVLAHIEADQFVTCQQVIGENIANLGLTNSRRCDDV